MASMPDENERRILRSSTQQLRPQPRKSSSHLLTSDQPSPNSRRRSPSTDPEDLMHHSVTSADKSAHLKFTKTGRVSKATKGERVHGCDECGKVYTRAEHLRRHKKNHNPGSLLCDAPDCGRSFFREDLLLRHMQRHADPDAATYRDGSAEYDSYRRHSMSSQYQGSDADGSLLGLGSDMRRASHISRSSTGQSPRYSFDAMPLTDLSRALSFNTKAYADYASLNQTSRRMQIDDPSITSYNRDLSNGYHWGGTSPPLQPYFSSSLTVSPRQPYYKLHDSCGRFAPHESMIELPPYSSRSSMPLDTIPSSNNEHWQTNFVTTGTSTAETPPARAMSKFTSGSFTRIDSLTSVSSPEERDFMEQSHLNTPTAGVIPPEFGHTIDLTALKEQHYINAYWHSMHVTWPIIHRESFNCGLSNPLLRASMIALGAQSTGEVTDMSNASCLHERCIKVLRKRTNNDWHSYRLVDMQAIILIELYAHFKSRRPPLQLSRCFEDVYRRLADDIDAYPSVLSGVGNYADLSSGGTLDVQQETKHRLLVACCILDRQQALYFGRPLSSCLSVAGEQLSYPRPFASWDASDEVRHDLTSYDTAYEVLNATSLPNAVSVLKQDIFRSMQLISCFGEPVGSHMISSWRTVNPVATIELLDTIDDSPRTRLAYHLSLLCKLTPVRDLLAVAGESWVMAEKISNQTEYATAQLEVREWANDKSLHPQSAHITALSHAFSILELHRQYPRSGLLAQEWGVYMASLVVWINAYTSHGATQRQRINAGSTFPSSHELERSVMTLVQTGPLQPVSWRDASQVLLWTKARLESVNVPHITGLNNGALDVLGKIVGRGHEETWLW